MTDAETSRSRQTRPHRSGRTASITPIFPLLLLETMRDMDRPEVVLEEEDLAVSMPRRLGLSDVVGLQIQRLREEVQRRKPQADEIVEDLIRLVSRRPDRREIFDEAGRRIARLAWDERSGMMRGTVRLLPRPAAFMAARRAARRLLKQMAGPGKLQLTRRPAELRIRGSITASADPSGSACSLYAGALAEVLQQYTGRSYHVGHAQCEALGAEACEWTATVAG